MNRPRTMKHWVMAAAALAVLAGCSDTIHGVEFAEPAVARFREMMEARQFDRLYDSTGAEFKAATPRADGIALFAAVDRKLGKLRGARKISWNVNTNNGLTLVALVYESRYAEGEATETFTVKVSDGTGEIVGYNIQSLAMLVK